MISRKCRICGKSPRAYEVEDEPMNARKLVIECPKHELSFAFVSNEVLDESRTHLTPYTVLKVAWETLGNKWNDVEIPLHSAGVSA